MQPAEVRAVARACRNIEGWFSAGAAQLFGLLDDAQAKAGIEGDLFEIGVHHGRSAVLLCHMARGGERVAVCDLFGAQYANASQSGHGDRAIFEDNVARLAPAGRSAIIFEKRSDELTTGDIGGPYRFFHIDGGHLVDEALGDLRLGAAVLHEHGVIVIDDPFNPAWPGVTEAVVRLLEERSDLSPVALGFNKLVLCRRSARSMYDGALADPWAHIDRRVWAAKELPLVGSPMRIFTIPSFRQIDGLDRWAALAQWLHLGIRNRIAGLPTRRR